MIGFTESVLAIFALSRYVLAQDSFTCPASNKQNVTTAAGQQYTIRCGQDTTGLIVQYTDESVTGGFNDCFAECNRDCIGPDCLPCSGFTFSGGENGAGGGTCYYKVPNSQGYTGFQDGSVSTLVGAIKVQYLPPQSPKFTCPQQDLQVVTDERNGLQYVLGCGRETFGGGVWNIGVADSFNDCFYACSTNGSGACTAFTYAGGVNGVGGGTCYMKDIPSRWVSGNENLVGAIQLARYIDEEYTPIYQTTTTRPAVQRVTTTTTTSTTRAITTSSSSTFNPAYGSPPVSSHCWPVFVQGPVRFCPW